MADYISREDAIKAVWKPEVRPNDLIFDALRKACEEEVKHVPAADVRPVAEISNAVDEVLDFLNDNSNCMPYHIYSALFDLVSGICHNCGADMREV